MGTIQSFFQQIIRMRFTDYLDIILVGLLIYKCMPLVRSSGASRIVKVVIAVLVAAWLATEFLYIRTEVLSFPWLVLGNGFSGSTWAVQWYEYTGVLGGSLWVLLANIAIFEALQHRTKLSAVRAGVVALLPVVVSLAIFWSYKPEGERVKISVVQPNVDCYAEKFNNTANKQLNNIVDLVEQTPADTKIIVLPETSLPELVDDDEPQDAASVNALSQLLAAKRPDAMIAAGAIPSGSGQ